MMYEQTDKVIKYLNRQYISAFRPLKSLTFDDVNAMSGLTAVNTAYEQIENETLARYLDLARRTYRYWYNRYSDDNISESAVAARITPEWVREKINGYDAVTKYVRANEVDRRRARLFEALMASPNKVKEVDEALRGAAIMNKHYADVITDEAQRQALRDAEVTYVEWRTEKDDRVCEYCVPLDGQVFPIDDIPPKVHYNCRCYVVPFFT